MHFIDSLLLLACFFAQATGSQFGELPGGNNKACSGDGDCPLIQCLIPPCPAAVCVDGSCTVEPNPPNPECIRDSDCPSPNVCNVGICEPQTPPENPLEVGNLVPGEISNLTTGAGGILTHQNDTEVGVPCGFNQTCPMGQACCNPSCGL